MSRERTLFEHLSSEDTHRYAVDIKPFVTAYIAGYEIGVDDERQLMWADPVHGTVQLNDKANTGKLEAVRCALEHIIRQLGGTVTWKKLKKVKRSV